MYWCVIHVETVHYVYSELPLYQTSPSVKVTVVLLEWVLSVYALIYIVLCLEGLEVDVFQSSVS